MGDEMKRGEIYYIESFYQEVGSEQKAGRPAVIVSNNNNNNNSEVVEVCYLTTKPKNDIPTHVVTRGTGIASTVLCEQIDSVSTARVGAWCGEVSEAEQRNIDIALAISVGIQPEQITAEVKPSEDEIRAMAIAYAKEHALVEKEGEPNKTRGSAVNEKTITKLQTEHALYKKLFEGMWNRYVIGNAAQTQEEEK